MWNKLYYYASLSFETKFKSFLLGLACGVGICSLIKFKFDDTCKKILDEKKKKINFDCDCILFVPNNISSENCYLKEDYFCGRLACSFCNFHKFLKVLSKATYSLDICVYLITCKKICDIIKKLFDEGVAVRIITDKQMSFEGKENKWSFFLKEHIPIIFMDAYDIMHNKFVIIDKKILITGSFNWSNHAFQRNCENGIIIRDNKIVTQFLQYFDCLWTNHVK